MIPRRFSLVNKHYLVRIVTTKQLQKHLDKGEYTENRAEDMCGLCDPVAERLFINKNNQEVDSDMEHTLWLELIHALKFAYGETEHCEQEVDRLGGMLHQFMMTAEGSKWALSLQ